MKHWDKFFLVLISCTLIGVTAALSQVTITESDASAAFANTAFQSQSDSINRSLNLGDATDGQSWDFSFITFVPASGHRDTADYISPTGQVEASSFSTATHCSPSTSSFHDSIWTTTIQFVIYFDLNSSGIYILGSGIHEHTSPTPPPGYPFPSDSSWVVKVSSPQRSIALPLSGNSAQWSYHDTTNDILTPGKFQENFHRYTPAGSGTITVPGGSTHIGVRYFETDSTVNHNPGGSTSTTATYHIVFFGKDGTQVEFTLATGSYSSGSVTPSSYSLVTSIGSATGVKQVPDLIPSNFALQQNYPNPFNPTTGIEFSLPEKNFVTVGVFNILGQEVSEIVRGTYAAGTYHVDFNAANLPSGVYLYRIVAGDFTQTRRMLLIK